MTQDRHRLLRVAHARVRSDRAEVATVAKELGISEREVRALVEEQSQHVREDIMHRWHHESDQRLRAAGHVVLGSNSNPVPPAPASNEEIW